MQMISDSMDNVTPVPEAEQPKAKRKALKKPARKSPKAKKQAKPKAERSNKKAEVIALMKRAKGWRPIPTGKIAHSSRHCSMGSCS
jgi:hypothetical protein